MERVCSINPPPYYVENLGQVDSMREIDLDSLNDGLNPNAW